MRVLVKNQNTNRLTKLELSVASNNLRFKLGFSSFSFNTFFGKGKEGPTVGAGLLEK